MSYHNGNVDPGVGWARGHKSGVTANLACMRGSQA